jgi:signal transduction histidine kinase
MVRSLLRNSIFRLGIIEKSHLRPTRAALTLALAYVALVTLYILMSSRLASRMASSVESLALIEEIKGVVYVLVSGALLFACALLAFRKIARQDSIIIAQNKSIAGSERLAMAGLFTSSICHDINNIMTVIMGNTAMISESGNLSEDDRRILGQVKMASEKLTALVGRMMELGKGFVPGQIAQEDLALVIKGTIDFARIHQGVKGCTLSYQGPDHLAAMVNKSLIARSLMNLILNAAQASSRNCLVEIRLGQEGAEIFIDVHDDGPGIPEEDKELIFQPFYTSKEDGNGLGLLSLKTCAEQHGGRVELLDSPLGGACFRLWLPVKTTTGPTPGPSNRSIA